MEGADFYIHSAKADAGLGVDPVLVNFARRRGDEIPVCHLDGFSAMREVAPPRGVGAQVKFLVPVAGIGVRELCSAR